MMSVVLMLMRKMSLAEGIYNGLLDNMSHMTYSVIGEGNVYVGN